MTKVEIKPTTRAHIQLIKDRLRTDAAKEVEMIGPDKEEAISYALTLSRYAWTGFANDEIACIVGINPASFVSRLATIWLITTPLVEAHSFLFLRWSRRFVEEIQKNKEFTTIHGQVRDEFTRSIWWLKWLGFKVQPPKEGLRYFYLETNKS